MKNNLILELIAGFLKATPKRLAITRNVLVALAGIGLVLVYLSSNGTVTIPEVIVDFFKEGGILSFFMAAFGIQLAKKDANEVG